MSTQKSIYKTGKLALLVALVGGGLSACQSSTNTTDTEEYRVDNDTQQVADYEPATPEPVAYAEPPVETTVNFAFDSAELSGEAKETLQDINEKLAEENYHNMRVVISGYADAVGGRAYNQELSERRAQSVKDYLQYSSTDIVDVDVQGYGETNPVMENDSAYGRQKNRRVEISFEMEESTQNYSMK
ncbi:Outer membrane protein A [Thalassocella blandensis]|nr:Outer membrane protein A [Thalassocella blandensis]